MLHGTGEGTWTRVTSRPPGLEQALARAKERLETHELLLIITRDSCRELCGVLNF